MKLHRFFVEDPELENASEGQEIEISSAELLHQAKNVLKLQIGESILLFNGNDNEYLASIVSFIDKSGMRVLVEKISKNEVSFKKEVALCFSLVKRGNVDWILEKGTEVGVTRFIPLLTSRSEKKDLNLERADRIVREASEQCGRNSIPEVEPVTKLKDVLERTDLSFIVLEKGAMSFREAPVKDTSIGLLVGPEGGWAEEEMAMFEEKGIAFRSLGPTVLRAETAAIVGSSEILNS